jgi:uncharacterized protein YkwD
MMTLAAAMLLASPLSAREGTLQLVDGLRTRDCLHPVSSEQRLHASAELDAAANQILKGRKIDDALGRASYRATRSTVIQLSGDVDDASLVYRLKAYCTTIADPGLTAIGVARGENQLAILLATPFAPPAARDANMISQEVLALVNEARARPRRCGTQRFAGAPPLALNKKRNAAAAIQAHDMATHGHMSHQGSDDSKPADRVTRVGYAWKFVGENVAAGQQTAQNVVNGWLASPGHCANIMNPDYTDMGIAYFSSQKQQVGIYWAQVFGRPR